jgi:hypothetical protein
MEINYNILFTNTKNMTIKYKFSRGESQFIFKAVGDVLLEIQTYISSSKQLNDSLDSVGPEPGSNTLSSKEKCIRFASNKLLSAEDIFPSEKEMSQSSINTFNQRDLDRTRLKTKTLSEINVGRRGYYNDVKSPKAFAKNKLPFKIESFFTFGRHNQIFSPSAEILVLSLIYIDRFINNKGLDKFNIPR